MREEEPSPNASPPLEELRASPSPWRGKRSCSCRVSHCHASWLLMREPREPLPSWRRGTRERESSRNRWKERTAGTVNFPKNKVTHKSFLLPQQIPFIQSYAGDVNQVIHIFYFHVCMIISLLRILRLWVEVEERESAYYLVLLIEKKRHKEKVDSNVSVVSNNAGSSPLQPSPSSSS
ncbi:hypothetical protein AHAS_Ahas13G0037100 [Arachis hypogaea]